MIVYNEDNFQELYEKISGGNLTNRQKVLFKKIKKELLVHTKGTILEKIYKNFPNETEEAHIQVTNSYEPITKGAIWKGIDNISRIFASTAFNIKANEKTLSELEEQRFYSEYTKDWIGTSVAADPNSVSVWIKQGGGLIHRIVESKFILHLDADSIAFIDVEKSEYEITLKQDSVFSHKGVGHSASVSTKYSCLDATYAEDNYNFGKRRIIYISKAQYLSFQEIGSNWELEGFDFSKELTIRPYAFTGTEEINKGVFHSPVAPFIPWGNLTLLTFRGFINSHYLFAYPRLEEVDQKCTNCESGQVSCTDCNRLGDQCDTCNSTQLCDCNMCDGSGILSQQSLFNVYRKVIEEGVDSNYDSVKFHAPDTSIFDYLKKVPMDYVREGEKSLYVQQDNEGGQAISAEAREKMLTGLYSWLGRIGGVFYDNLEHTIKVRQQLQGDFSEVKVEVPNSYAILSELEANKIISEITSSDSPSVIKNNQIKSLIGKYLSKGNHTPKMLKVLLTVDRFALYNKADFENISFSGDVLEEHRFYHAYAQSTLDKLLAEDPNLINQECDIISTKLKTELNSIPRSNSVQTRTREILENG